MKNLKIIITILIALSSVIAILFAPRVVYYDTCNIYEQENRNRHELFHKNCSDGYYKITSYTDSSIFQFIKSYQSIKDGYEYVNINIDIIEIIKYLLISLSLLFFLWYNKPIKKYNPFILTFSIFIPFVNFLIAIIYEKIRCGSWSYIIGMLDPVKELVSIIYVVLVIILVSRLFIKNNNKKVVIITLVIIILSYFLNSFTHMLIQSQGGFSCFNIFGMPL
jgi:hypothetical protein